LKTNSNDLKLQRPTWAEIDLDALHSNYHRIQKIAPRSRVLAVVKSDGYGHGAAVIAKELQDAGVDLFATATAEEAILLRKNGITDSILVLGGMTPEQFPILLDQDLILTVYNHEVLFALEAFTQLQQKRVRIHIKVDTGMGRLGFSPEDASRIMARKYDWIEIDGLFTHLASSDVPADAYTLEQLRRFDAFLAEYRGKIPMVHTANSGAVLQYPESHYDVVRPGTLLYGISPLDAPSEFEPILSLKSKIILLHWIKKGESIGYGRTFTADRDTLIATVPIGYSDGLRRSLSNRLDVEVRGKMCRIAGTISMDLCMLDVTDISTEVQLYDTVTFIGPRTTAWDWAKLLDTIPYEIICLIGARVPRVYMKQGEVWDIYYP
jgi:alanine racemase